MPRCGVRLAQRADPTLPVDIATPEFSLAFRRSSGRCRCKLWPKNENLIFESDFNARANRADSDHGNVPLGRESARRVMFTISGMVMLMGQAQ